MTSTLDIDTPVPLTTPATRTRRLIGSTCLFLGAVGIVAIGRLNPYDPAMSQVQVARTRADQITTWSLIWLTSSLLLLVGIGAIVGQVRGRGSALAMVGGALAGAGAVGSAAFAALETVTVTLSAAIPSDDQLASILAAFDTSASPTLYVVVALYLGGTALGLPLLTGATARAGLIPAWLVLPVVLAALGFVVAPDVSVVIQAVISLAFLVPMGILALRIAAPTAR